MQNILCVFILSLMILLKAAAFAQEKPSTFGLKAIALHGRYLHHVTLKSGEGLNRAQGFGGNADVQFRFTRIFSINLAAGYADLGIDQDDAVNRWNWGFWERFYRNYVRDLQQRDPNYVATFTPRQRLQMVPVHLTAGMSVPLRLAVKPEISFGGSLYRYKRTLTLHERWQKNFPELNYTYIYEFDNHAEKRTGTVFGLIGGLSNRWQPWRWLALDLGGRYHWIIPTQTREAYRYFPVKSFVEVLVGAVFVY